MIDEHYDETENDDTYQRIKEQYYLVKKPKNKVMKIFLTSILTIIILFSTLFTIGFIMGKSGYKPQKLDLKAFTNQVFDGKDEDYTELKKVEKST